MFQTIAGTSRLLLSFPSSKEPHLTQRTSPIACHSSDCQATSFGIKHTWVVRADMSGILTSMLERSMAKVTGPLTVERLPGVSHWVQQEVPAQVSALLIEAFHRSSDA